MSFRFRRTFKIAPGIKINLSKTGFSTSFGGKGNTINVGKKGIQHTVGLPGTGLSFRNPVTKFSNQPGSNNIDDQFAQTENNYDKDFNSNSSKLTKSLFDRPWIIISIAVILLLCAGCFGISFISGLIVDPTPTLTPTATMTIISISKTPFLLPTRTLAPTKTYTLIPLPTSIKTLTATFTVTHTPSLVKSPTPKPATPKPVSTTGGPCACTSDLYNCSYFSTHNQAQACYDYCFTITGRDVHKIDGSDNDGKACESLP